MRLWVFLLGLVGVLPLAAQVPADAPEYFEKTIRPLLANRCFACHADAAKGGLRLDSRAAVLTGGGRGPAVVPGDGQSSLLIQAVDGTHSRLRMPPTGELSAQDMSALEQWVEAGVYWPEASAAAPSAADREPHEHWSFQPVRRPRLPFVGDASNPIDAFVQERLAAAGLEPSAEAGKLTLLRRVTYDLTGLPPTLAEIDVFVRDDAPGAYYRLVERLLASPRYGERWGRHWMDVVRYADTAGDSADYPIPQAAKYRDYVIEAFQRDKPYDEFIREQIAGDLLPAADDDDRWENTVASGYIALARRFSVTPEAMMHLTYEDAIDNLGKTFLGLSLGCARCHDHKFDPISQSDYYALYGIFDSTSWPFAGSENRWGQYGLVPRDAAALRAWTDPVREEWDALDAELAPLIAASTRAYGQANLADDPTVRDRLRDDQSGARKRMKELVRERRELLAKLPPPPEQAWAVAEGEPHDVPLHVRGEPNQLGAVVPRGFLDVLGGQKLADPTQSGRLELANWIADPSNPLTARVLVNRVWQHHFGRGLVGTPNDFGARGGAPTHPELLDHLADWFVKNGWSIKALHRLVLLSNTYRQSSAPREMAAKADPENRLLWRQNRWRLDAEALRDSLLAAGGTLDLRASESHPFPPQGEWSYSQHNPFQAVYASNRRSVFLMTQRIQKHPFLTLFDGADPNASTPRRVPATNPIQSLYLMNAELVHASSAGLAARLRDQPLPEAADTAHRYLLGRPATSSEAVRAREYLTQAQLALGRAGVAEEQHREQALASYIRALLASNEFLYVD